MLEQNIPHGKFNSGTHNFGHARSVVVERTMMTVRQRSIVKVSTACMRVDAHEHIWLRKLENGGRGIPQWMEPFATARAYGAPRLDARHALVQFVHRAKARSKFWLKKRSEGFG